MEALDAVLEFLSANPFICCVGSLTVLGCFYFVMQGLIYIFGRSDKL